MMRRRDAPIASRMPISRWRATARASSRLATFAHPIIRMRPNAKKSGMNSSMTSADSGTVPCLGSSTRLAAGRSPERSAARRESHTRSCASAWPRDRPGFSRPTMWRPTESSRPCWPRRNWPRSESGAQKSGAATVESSKAFRHHADNLERRAVHQDRAVEHAGIARKVPGPGAMAEDDDRTAAGLVVRRCERAPTRGADAEDVEEVPRDERALHPAALDPGVDVRRPRECIGEHARLADERVILRAREASRAPRWPIADVRPRTARAGCAPRRRER